MLYRQPNPFGCIYYSFASMVALPLAWAARYERDCSYERFLVRAWREGFMMMAYYTADEPCAPEWWENTPEEGDVWHWHVCVDSLTWRETKHQVGVVQRWSGGEPIFEVYDTAGFEAVQVFTPEAFAESPYARAYAIHIVNTNRVSSWAPSWPEDAPHIQDPEGLRK